MKSGATYKYKALYIPLIAFIALLLFIRLLFINSYSVDLDGLEYYFLEIVNRVNEGKPLYTDPGVYPYSNCLYTPIYFYVYGSYLKMQKLNLHDHLHQMLVAGRFLSLSFLFVTFWFLKKLSSKAGVSGFSFIIILALFITLLTGHAYAVRPDALKLLFFAVFLYTLIEYLFFSGRIIFGIAAVVAAVAAVYTKQDISIHITVCLLVALYFRRDKRTFFLTAAFFTFCAVLFTLMYLHYGKILISNLILFNSQSVTNIFGSYNIYFLLLSLLRLAPLLVITIKNYLKLKHVPALTFEKFIAICTLILFITVHLSLLRPGANFNYTYELLIFLLMNLCIYMRDYSIQIMQKKIRYMLLLILYLFFLLLFNTMLRTYTYDPMKHASYQKEYDRCMKDRDAIRTLAQNDTIFFPNTKYSIFYPQEHIVLGHDMHLDRFINLYTSVHIESRLTSINTEAYDENFKNGKIKYILIDKTAKSVSHVQHYYPEYSLSGFTSNFYVYKFNKNGNR